MTSSTRQIRHDAGPARPSTAQPPDAYPAGARRLAPQLQEAHPSVARSPESYPSALQPPDARVSAVRPDDARSSAVRPPDTRLFDACPCAGRRRTFGVPEALRRSAVKLTTALADDERGEVIPTAIIYAIAAIIAVALLTTASDYVLGWIGIWPDAGAPAAP